MTDLWVPYAAVSTANSLALTPASRNATEIAEVALEASEWIAREEQKQFQQRAAFGAEPAEETPPATAA